MYRENIINHKNTKEGNKSKKENIFPGTFYGVVDIFKKAENIIQGPIEDKTGGGIIKKNQKNKGHAVQLNFIPRRQAAKIHRSGNDVDEGHEQGQNIQGKAAGRKKGIGLSEVIDKEEMRPFKGFKTGQVRIRGNKKRYLYQKPKGGTKRKNRVIMILPVIGGKNHILFVPFENGLDFFDLWVQAFLRIPFRLLPSFGYHIKGKAEYAHRNTDEGHGYSRFFENLLGENKNKFDNQRQGINNNRV
jgi:hypothetical protein